MNILPIVHLIQWQAQLAIDRGVPVTYNARTTAQIQSLEWEMIVNG